MSSVLNRSLIFVILMALGLAVYTQWFNYKAERFDKTAFPYIEKTLPVVTNWQFDQFRPLLSPAARSWFESDEGRELYRLFSQLGRLISMDKPQYLRDQGEKSESLGGISVVAYEVPLEFDTGPSFVKLDLMVFENSYLIHRISFSSKLFSDQKAAESE